MQAHDRSQVETRSVTSPTENLDPARRETTHPSELWRGYWGIQVLHAGQSMGLFQALSQPNSVGALAQQLQLEPRYLQLWCEAAESYGLLERRDDKYVTPDTCGEWLHRSGGFTQSHLHLSRRMTETMQAVFGGRALPEPPISLRLLLQESLQANYEWLFQESTQAWPPLEKILTGENRVLEVGCGVGYGLSHLRTFHPNLELVGLEVDYECAQEAERATKAVIHISESPGNRFGRPFNLILCFRSLSAAAEPEKLLRDCAETLAEGGVFILGSEVTDIDNQRKSGPRLQGEKLAYNILAGEALVNEYSREELKTLLSNSGFELKKEVDAPDWATPLFICERK